MKIRPDTLCVCKHEAAKHLAVSAGPYNDLPKGEAMFLDCNWNETNRWGDSAIWGSQIDDDFCKCKLFKQDNLEYLRRKHESKRKA